MLIIMKINKQELLLGFLVAIIGYYVVIARASSLDLIFVAIGAYSLTYVLAIAMRWFDPDTDMEGGPLEYWNWERVIRCLILFVLVCAGLYVLSYSVAGLWDWFWWTYRHENWFWAAYLVLGIVGFYLLYGGYLLWKRLKREYIIYYELRLRLKLGDEEYERLRSAKERMLGELHNEHWLGRKCWCGEEHGEPWT